MVQAVKNLLILSVFLVSAHAEALPLTDYQDFVSAGRADAQRVGNTAILVRGAGTRNFYYLEIDPTTGRLPVDASVTSSDDHNYGTVGASTLRTASQIGNATGAAAFGAGTTSAQTLRVVLPTDQSAIPVTASLPSSVYADSVRNDYSSVNVTTGAWVELIAATAANIDSITLFDSCGETLELGTGAAAAETRVLLIPPGGIDGQASLTITSGTRISVRAVSGNCTSGEIDITGFG